MLDRYHELKYMTMNLKTFLLSSLSLIPHAHGAKPSLPTLDLPWGSYPATVLLADKKIYLFENVRFGAQPVRFGASDFPNDTNNGIQVAPKVTDCLQINPYLLSNGPGGKSPLGDPNQDLDPDKPHTSTVSPWSGTEDCLFLDVYVPRSVFDNPGSQPPLPVTVWFYGGAYTFGTKRMSTGPLYSGRSLIKASNYTTIFVAGNYRLGAFGWLAGSFMQTNGLPRLDQVYQNFSDSLGCHAPYDIECIRNPSIPLKTLGMANVKLFENVNQTGLFPIGPSVDNAWIKTIPTLAFSQKKFWTGIKSAIVSHCANDAQRFTPDSEMYAPLRTKIANKYNCVRDYGGDYNLCLRHVIRDASFTCNTRDLLDSYPKQAYAMNYGFPNDDMAYHATDIVPLFANLDKKGQIFIIFWRVFKYPFKKAQDWALQLRSDIIPIYRGYFSSFARYGNTNGTGDLGWPVVNGSGSLFSNVMKPSANGWNLVEDDQNSKDTCAFWNIIAQNIMKPQPPPGWKTDDADMDKDVSEEL
ncbi:COesterase domain-containing protein [Fusarium sp. LHS14.1]|nr:COesterase domain-containing protein [Fusarium sp. LHS14.1]